MEGQVSVSHYNTTQIPSFENLWISLVDAIEGGGRLLMSPISPDSDESCSN